MTTKQLEQRIEALEREMTLLKGKVEGTSPVVPWWERITGTFQDDPVYNNAMKLGREYRSFA